MKIIFIALSIIFFSACSNVEVSGYTESIVKNAKNSVSSSSSEKESKSEETKISALEEDLSSLDDESLREKLLNYYPWPKPKADPTPEPKAEPKYSETTDLKYSTPDGYVEIYSWKETKVSFNEPASYEYGFDRDPTDLDPIVYISVLEPSLISPSLNSKAKFIPHYTAGTTYSEYRLLHEKNSLEDINKEEALLKSSEEKELDKTGEYTLYGKNKRGKWIELANKIDVIPYSKIIKNITVIEMNGDKKISDIDKDNNNFITAQSIKESFNNVFNQALVYANINGANEENKESITIERIGKNELVEIDMQRPTDDFLINALLETSTNLQKEGQKEDSKYWHVIYAINKARKIWYLDDCQGDLKKCNQFKPYLESNKTTYKLVTMKEPCDDWKNKEKEEDVSIRISKDGKFYHLFNKKLNKFINNLECKVLYTDNGFPIIPTINGVLDGDFAVNIFLDDKLNENWGDKLNENWGSPVFSFPKFQPHDSYLPRGGMAIVPRRAGSPSQQYAAIHELGHTFGLTDVAQSELFLPSDIYDISIQDIDARQIYASYETNLMSWQTPNGKRIRYRSTPIACTRGKQYYNSEGKYIGSVELLNLEGSEKQWECVRGKCYDSKYKNIYPQDYYHSNYSVDIHPGFSNKARKEHWLHTGICNDEAKKLKKQTSEKYESDKKDSWRKANMIYRE